MTSSLHSKSTSNSRPSAVRVIRLISSQNQAPETTKEPAGSLNIQNNRDLTPITEPNYLAMPKNTAKQRSTSTIASESMCPKAGPSLSRFIVIALSTIT